MNPVHRVLSLACLSSLAIAFSAPAPARAADGLKPLLAHQIIGPDLAMQEAQAFCESRVPAMPTPATAAEWEPIAARIKKDMLDKVIFRGEAAKWRDAACKVEWLGEIEGGPGYKIKKLRYEALPGLWIPALLYEPLALSGKVPVTLNVNGHDAVGKAAPYKQIRCINMAKRGMIALNAEWFQMGQLRTDGFTHGRMNQLDLCGSAGIAIFYLAMQRGLDLLLAHPNADPARTAIMGLSGGGWQTSFFSPLDDRVVLSNPVAGYSSFKTRARNLSDLGDSEQTPDDMATYADYTHMTALRAPRPTLLTFNAKDECCFASGHALRPLLDAAQPIFRLHNKEANLRSHVNDDPGTHNFERDNREAVYKMMGDFFHAGDASYSATEIPSDDEVKTAEQLAVEMPEKNEDFHTLASALAASLPRDPALPQPAALAAWRAARRATLKEIVRFEPYSVAAERVGEETQGATKAAFWKLRLGSEWTVPAVELSRGDSKETALLLADGGRMSDAGAAEADRLLAAGMRVVAVDVFYFGESRMAQRDYLFALLAAGVGRRPLGIQSAQALAASQWATGAFKSPTRLVAAGPRSSLIAAVAAAMDDDWIKALELRQPYGSLKEIIEQNLAVEKAPELFCFGLLESFDMKQLLAMAAPRAIRVLDASPRVNAELAGLGGRLEITAAP